MRRDPSDFMGGLFDFVAALLNGLFRTEFSGRVDTTVWTRDDGGIGALTIGQTTQIPVSMAPPDATVTPAPKSMLDRAHDQIAALQTTDPDFNEVQFLTQAGSAYSAYLAAEGAMDPSGLDAIATPGFVEAFRSRVEDWKSGGLRRVVSGVKMDVSTIFKASVDGTQQSVVARFVWTGTRCTQDVSTGIAEDGSLQPTSVTEFATFVRPAGSTTPKTAATGAALHCPSCGAPAEAGATSCPYCGTQLTGTGGTWLLDHVSVSAYT